MSHSLITRDIFLIRTQRQTTKLLSLIISRACLYEKSYENACRLIASRLLLLSLSYSPLPFCLLVCLFIEVVYRFWFANFSLSRFATQSLSTLAFSFFSFYFCYVTFLSTVRFTYSRRPISGLFSRLLSRSGLITLVFPPSSPLFPRPPPEYFLETSEFTCSKSFRFDRSVVRRVLTHEIRIWLLHTFAICEIAFAAMHTSVDDDHLRHP